MKKTLPTGIITGVSLCLFTVFCLFSSPAFTAKNSAPDTLIQLQPQKEINAPALERQAGQRPPYSAACQGIDLAIEKVELKRASGNLYIRATVKNLCKGSCSADGIDIEIDESLIPGAAGGIVQPIGVTSIEPEGVYSNSWVGVRSNPAGRSTYTVRAALKGSSRSERTTTNNSCRASIEPGQTQKTVRCL